MAYNTKAQGYGLTAECERKKAARFDPSRANEALDWLKAILEFSDPSDPDIAGITTVCSMDDVCRILKDGVVLCKVANVLYPGSVKKINKITNPNSHFKKAKEQENISNFLTVCEQHAGCVKADLFQTVDLYEEINIPSVVDGIYALGRKCHTHENAGIPKLGPKEAEEHAREFTEEQLAAGKNVIGLQMGTNQLASQSGQNFGKTRAIID